MSNIPANNIKEVVNILTSFEWGISTAYGHTTDQSSIKANGSFSTLISDLAPGTTYHYRAGIEGPDMVLIYGKDKVLVTLPETKSTSPTVTPTPMGALSPALKSGQNTGLISPDKDTDLVSSSQTIKLHIPKGAVTEAAQATITEHTAPDSGGMRFIKLFELNANSVTSKNKVSKFNTSLGITITNETSELAGIDPKSIGLYYIDDTGSWVPVSTSKFDSASKLLTASVDHFTFFGELGSDLSVGPGRVMAANVTLASGTATFSYPIELPPGPGNFQPKIELNYNSGVADEMKDKRAVGSWAGIGWTLHFGRISYDAVSQLYFLDLNDRSYQLATTDGINFHTNPDQYFKITRSTDGNTWNLYDKSGLMYQFGGTPDSMQYLPASLGGYYRWDMSLMQDTNGNQAIVSYAQDIYNGAYPTGHVRSAYPEYLTYGGGNSANIVQIHFISSYDTQNDPTDGNLRNDDPKTYNSSSPAPEVMENRKLDAIEVKIGTALIRKYVLTYTTTSAQRVQYYDNSYIWYAGKHTLSSITQYGTDGSSTLPTMSFSYQDEQIYRHGSEVNYLNGNPGNPAIISWPHLTEVDSDYGGSTSFSYTQNPDVSARDLWSRVLVNTKTTNPGTGMGPAQTVTYNYTNIAYRGVSWNQQYRVFDQVKETDGAGNYIIHKYYTTGTLNGKDADKLTGLEYDTKWYDSGDNLLRETANTWDPVQTTQDYRDVNWNWSTGAAGDDCLYGPRYITTTSDGSVYLTDNDGSSNSKHRVLKFDQHGKLLQTIGSYGTGPGQFYYPYGICADSAGNIYVADTGNHRIQKFVLNSINQLMIYSAQWGSYGSAVGQFNNPYGIAVDSSGNLYVADTGNNRIQKYNGTSWSLWGGSFNQPMDIVDNDASHPLLENIYVCDTANSLIKIYSTSGVFQSQFGGSGDNQLSWPWGIGTDSNGHIFIADHGNNRIEEFTLSGTFLHKWDGETVDDVAVSNYSMYFTNETSKLVKEYLYNWAVQLTEIDTTTGSKTNRTSYLYDSYGNVVTEYHDGDTSTTADDSTIWRAYYHNTDLNILNKVARETTYAAHQTSEVGGFPIAQTLYYYDNHNTDQTTLPDKGNLTRVKQSVDSLTNTIHTDSTYDSYGNKLTEVDPNNNTTTWTYEPTYNTYPLTKTDPAVTGGTFTEHYAYDPGTNNLTSQIDINNQTTSYQYDPFKRLIKVFKPGDDPVNNPNNPSIKYEYVAWGTLNSQNIKTSTKISDGNFIWKADYFDGLGRIVQTQTNGESGHAIISTTLYNTTGQVDKKYVSQDVTPVPTGYVTPVDSPPANAWKYTAYNYDGLGRVLRQTNPDGTFTSNDYRTAWQVTATNELGNNNILSYDAFGRLTKVQNNSQSTPASPTVVTSVASNIQATAITLNGYLFNPGSAASVNVNFEYGTTTSYGTSTTAQPMTSEGTFNSSISNLSANTLYHFRAKAVSSVGTSYGNDLTIYTAQEIPKAILAGGDDGFSVSGGGSGSSYPAISWYEAGNSGAPYNAWFRFTAITIPAGAVIDEAYLRVVEGSFSNGTVLKISAEDAANPAAPLNAADQANRARTTANVPWTSGLAGYQWRNSPSFTTVIQELVNKNAYSNEAIQILVDNNGSISGSEAVGYTYENTRYAPQLYIRYHIGTNVPPAVSTNNADAITTTSANLNGNLINLGNTSNIAVSFEYGTTTSYGTTTTTQPLTAAGTFSAILTGLTNNTTYHFRAKAAGNGTGYGNDLTFSTSGQSVITTGYTYDALGNLTQVVDNSYNTTTMTYDWLSRKTGMNDPDTGISSYVYDNNGNLHTQTDAKNQVATMAYDALNRLTGKTYSTGMTAVSYAYDSGTNGKGKKTGMTDGSGSAAYTYDARGRLTQESKIIDTVTYSTYYTYDGADRVLTTTYPITNEVVTQNYTGRGLPNTLSGSVAGSLVTSTLYNNLGSMSELRNPWIIFT